MWCNYTRGVAAILFRFSHPFSQYLGVPPFFTMENLNVSIGKKKKPIWSVRLKSGSPLCAEEALIASPPARGKSLSLASLLLLLAYAGCWYEGSPVDRAEFSACMVQCGRCYSLGSETGHPLDIGRWMWPSMLNLRGPMSMLTRESTQIKLIFLTPSCVWCFV